MPNTAKTDIIPHPLWRVAMSFSLTVTEGLAQKISDALEDVCLAVLQQNRDATDGDDWVITLTTMGEPDLGEIYRRLHALGIEENIADFIDEKDISAEKLPEQDWLSYVHDNFPPITVGKFFIYGSHYEGAVPAELTPLKIDAATAFGSGEHETTKGCIQAFEYLAGQGHVFTNALDMGCGSGILAIAITKIWNNIPVIAIDIDPESIIVTKRHALMNGASAFIQAEAGDGYRVPLVPQHAPYDLIAANILANPLIEMAPDLAENLKTGGFCVLSGLLARQKDDVVRAHEAQGLKLVHAEEIGDWRALVLQKL
jgi:ribosomal protein L11 methyltransferase